MKLEGKVALVTGSSQGIALRLVQEGADIVINYLTKVRPMKNALYPSIPPTV